MKLVIVESPAKSKTIQRFLGKGYQVHSSMGHVRDLPKSELGVEVDKDFKPKYVVPPKAKKIISQLKKMVLKSDALILATDEDREGEAIAWHIVQALGLNEIKNKKLKVKNFNRIVFHEITKKAILNAVRSPREINMHLVDAQQARRVLDRLVGYKLSPLLWKKIARGLSAGRVQSPALRLVVEREAERDSFKSREYWTITGFFKHKQGNFAANFTHYQGKKLDKFAIENKEKAHSFLVELKKQDYSVLKISNKEQKRHPLPPFTTASLQQYASSRLGFTPRRTMRIAQQLYEGISIKGKGQLGLITYMRTDSVNLAQNALTQIAQFISRQYGAQYLNSTQYKTKGKHSQEAHEAIRPTNVSLTPKKVRADLTLEQYKLYELIWRRAVASQMSSAVFSVTTASIISPRSYQFTANGLQLKFDGFTRVWKVDSKEQLLPRMQNGDRVKLDDLKPEQHFTQPPPRFSEATLIKALKDYGIGRPSTYAPIISMLLDRRYVEKDENKKLYPTELGKAVANLLIKHFPNVVDYSFTAKMEDSLDAVASGKLEWQPLIRSFYTPFEKRLKVKEDEIERKTFTETSTNKKCPDCKAPIVKKLGRFGPFYSCSAFPDCKYIERIKIGTKVTCPECKKGEMVERRTRKGKIFYSCERYPECRFAVWDKPTTEECSTCKSMMTITNRGFKRCSNKDCPTRGKIKGVKHKT